MTYFKVSFQYSETTYCTNIALAKTVADVEKHYSGYAWFSIKEATEADVEEAKRKGMPIIEIKGIETFEDLAQTVADEFKKEMEEGEFESFEEMRDCYWWTSKDIKEEVDYIIRQATDGDACIDEYDGTDVYLDGTSKLISYRKFSAMWHKLLKAEEEEEDE